MVLAALWLAATAGVRPLMLPDEGRYVGVAWEMLHSGQWAVPTLNGLPYFHKPPLFYWITAASLGLFGTNDWAARVAPLLGALLCAGSLYRFVSRQLGAELAWVSVLVLVTMPFFYVGAQFANLDMLVAGCISASILAFAQATLAADDPRALARARLWGWVFAALGVLAKGLIGIVIPLAVVALWLLATRQARLLVRLALGIGPLLFLAVAAPWFVLMQLRHPGFFEYFVFEQHVRRFAAGGFNNAQPFWFYLPVIAVLTLPWPAVWVARLFAAGAQAAAGPAALRQLLWIWLGVVVLFFSIPQSKLVGYVLPVLPPLALLTALGLRQGIGVWTRWQRAPAVIATLAALTCLLAVTVIATRDRGSNAPLARVLQQQAGPGDGLLYVENFPFDLAWLLRRSPGVAVVDDWSDAQVDRNDNWRKELRDAARFAPALRSRLLIDRATMGARLCAQDVTWVVAPTRAGPNYPLLAAAAPLAATGGLSLWRVTRASADAAGACAGVPPAPVV